MKITEAVRGAWRRVAGVSSAAAPQGIEKMRRTSGLPSIFNSYGSLTESMPKPTPYNLRRFSETPIARRAINCIKDRIAGMRWRIQPRQGYLLESIPNGAERVRLLTSNFECPNPDDSFRSMAEQVLEDIIVGGYGAIEVQINPGWRTRLHFASLRVGGADEGPPPHGAACDVAGGWRFDSDESGVGRIADVAALRASKRSVRTRRLNWTTTNSFIYG